MRSQERKSIGREPTCDGDQATNSRVSIAGMSTLEAEYFPSAIHRAARGMALTSPQQAALCPCFKGTAMLHLSPPTLTESEQKAILRATARNPRDHLIYSLALGTGLRLAEVVGLDVGEVFASGGTPRSRVRIHPEVVRNGGGVARRLVT